MVHHKRRIEEAAHVIELDRLGLCPQCGFASRYRYDRMVSTCRSARSTCSLPQLVTSGGERCSHPAPGRRFSLPECKLQSWPCAWPGRVSSLGAGAHNQEGVANSFTAGPWHQFAHQQRCPIVGHIFVTSHPHDDGRRAVGSFAGRGTSRGSLAEGQSSTFGGGRDRGRAVHSCVDPVLRKRRTRGSLAKGADHDGGRCGHSHVHLE